MNDIHNDKPKRLTLDKNRILSLGKAVERTNIKREVLGNRNSTTVVEVKKSNAAKLSRDIASFNNTSADISDKLDLIKKAADEMKQNANNNLNTLSQLMAINRDKTQLESPAQDQQESGNVDAELTTASNNATTSPTATTKSSEVAKIEIEPVKAKEKESVKHLHKKTEVSEEVLSDKNSNEIKPAVVKNKNDSSRKVKKADLFFLVENDNEELGNKRRSLASVRRAKEKEKRKHAEQFKPEKVYREVIFSDIISVSDLANRMSERVADVIKELMKLGVIATSLQLIDADTAELVVLALGHTPKRVHESDVENILTDEIDNPQDLKYRAPIVTVMGHVDHGKTSLLDALRSTNVVEGEAGGITQHIGAYKVILPDNKFITFLDTPGHEAFTEMRARGSSITDIVIIVIAADDGIKPQTVEAINHAKAANVPIIVAINKIDKSGANKDKIINELLMHGLVPEDLGGDVITVEISALKRLNLDKLMEAILLVAELKELKANPNARGAGVVIEARVQKGIGIAATILVQRGTVNIGDIIVAGSAYGKIKLINNDQNIHVTSAGPSEPIEIYGLTEVPKAGDMFNVVLQEKQARDIAEYRSRTAKNHKISITKSASLEDLFRKASGEIKTKELALIIKSDVHGSLEAITASLLKLPNQEISVKIIHAAVGAITESDISLANALKALVIGFNVRANHNAAILAEQNKVDIRYYSIIYDLIDDIKTVMSGMLSPILREEFIGTVEIREVFNITKVGNIAGSYVTKGIIKRGAGVRLLRDNIVVHEGKLKTLKRFKDDVKEVRENFECGIAFENYDRIQVGDVVEVFEIIQEQRKL